MKRLEDMDEPELRDLCTKLALGLEYLCEKLGVEKPHFALLLFNDPKIAQYVCNCQRSDVIKAMRACADRLAKKEDVPR